MWMQIEERFREEYFLKAPDFLERRSLIVKYSETANGFRQTGEKRSGQGCNATILLLSGPGRGAHPTCSIYSYERKRCRVVEVVWWESTIGLQYATFE